MYVFNGLGFSSTIGDVHATCDVKSIVVQGFGLPGDPKPYCCNLRAIPCHKGVIP